MHSDLRRSQGDNHQVHENALCFRLTGGVEFEIEGAHEFLDRGLSGSALPRSLLSIAPGSPARQRRPSRPLWHRRTCAGFRHGPAVRGSAGGHLDIQVRLTRALEVPDVALGAASVPTCGIPSRRWSGVRSKSVGRLHHVGPTSSRTSTSPCCALRQPRPARLVAPSSSRVYSTNASSRPAPKRRHSRVPPATKSLSEREGYRRVPVNAGICRLSWAFRSVPFGG
jgi:hypothetical protein